MKTLTTFLASFLLSTTTVHAVPDGGWLVREHRGMAPPSDLMLDAHVLPDGITGVIGGGDIVFCTWDGGRHWYNSILPGFPYDQDILGLCACSPESVWVACDYGWIARTVDGGTTWETQRPTTTNMFEVFFLDHLHGWAGGSSGDGRNHLMRSADGGASWVDASFGYDGSVIAAVFFIDGNTGWAGGKDSAGYPCLYRTDDGGGAWTRQTLPFLPFNSAVESVEFFDSDNGWVATNNSQAPGFLLHTSDGGDSWTINTTLPLQYTRFDPLDPLDLAAVSYSGGSSWLSRSLDGGQNWVHVQTPIYGYLPALAHFDGFIAVSGETGTILGTPDDGTTWWMLSSSDIIFESMSWAGDEQVLCAGEGSIYTSPDGDSWSGMAGPQGGGFVFFHDGMNGWILDSGPAAPMVWRTDDGGAGWTLSTPGVAFEATGLFFADASTGWLYGEDGSLYRSNDSGESWASQDPGTSMDVRDAFFVDASTGWVAGGAGLSSFVSHTSDGTSWQMQQLPPGCGSIAALSFPDPLLGWAVSDGGTVCRTSDGGWSWSLQSQLPSDGCRDILMTGSESGWVLSDGGDIIYFTADGGATWSLDWQDPSCGVLEGLAAGPSGSFWAFGSEATVLEYDSTTTSIPDEGREAPDGSSLLLVENPVSCGTALLSVSCPGEGEASFDIYDMAGRRVAASGPIYTSAGWNTVPVDVSDLCNGMYLVRYGSGPESGTLKLVIVR